MCVSVVHDVRGDYTDSNNNGRRVFRRSPAQQLLDPYPLYTHICPGGRDEFGLSAPLCGANRLCLADRSAGAGRFPVTADNNEYKVAEKAVFFFFLLSDHVRLSFRPAVYRRRPPYRTNETELKAVHDSPIIHQ